MRRGISRFSELEAEQGWVAETSLLVRDSTDDVEDDENAVPDLLAPIVAAFQTLPEQTQEILRLRTGFSPGYAYSYDEIAKLLGISTSEACTQANDGLAEIQKQLQSTD